MLQQLVGFWRWIMLASMIELSRLVFWSSETTARGTTLLRYAFFVHACQAKKICSPTCGWWRAQVLHIDRCVARFVTAPLPWKLFLAKRSRSFWTGLFLFRFINRNSKPWQNEHSRSTCARFEGAGTPSSLISNENLKMQKRRLQDERALAS